MDRGFLMGTWKKCARSFQAAREAGAKVPFIEQTLPTDDAPFGGW
jgi:hypothetical protein